MFKKSLMASLAVCVLALAAPVPATALAASGDCFFESVQHEPTTGQNYEGVAYGFAVDDTGGDVTIACYITVNAVAAPGAIVSGSGTGVAVAAGPISFEATPDDDVEICTVINGGPAVCSDSTSTQFPPQEVFDLIDSVLEQVFALIDEVLVLIDPVEVVVDAVLCPVLAQIHSVVVHTLGQPLPEIDHEGDVFVDGIMVWDCPVYGDGVYDA